MSRTELVIEYWADRRGREPVREYIEALDGAGEWSPVATFERRVDLLAERGPAIGMPIARLINRRERLYELYFGDHRCAYVQIGDSIVLLHALAQAHPELDAREERRALRRLASL